MPVQGQITQIGIPAISDNNTGQNSNNGPTTSTGVYQQPETSQTNQITSIKGITQATEPTQIDQQKQTS
jgi:hypothetical protein